jgi:hypothetical protein
VALRPATLLAALESHRAQGNAVTFPVGPVPHPYVHFVGDASGLVRDVLLKKRGDEMPSPGLNDCGAFFLRIEPVRSFLLKSFRDRYGSEYSPGCGSLDSEFDLLPLFPEMVRQGLRVALVPIALPEETLGVNTLADVASAEKSRRLP